MTMLLWLAGLAFATPTDGFAVVRDTDGCRISMRPPEDPRGAAMRAECDWPEVPTAPLQGVIGRYDQYPRFVFPLDEVQIRRVEADRTLVYQRQQLFGLADREVLLWMTHDPQAAGDERVSWVAAGDEPLTLRPGAIRTPRNTGFWQVGPAAGGGTHVVHEISVDAGGYVPRWLIDLVRTRAFARILSDLRDYANGL